MSGAWCELTEDIAGTVFWAPADPWQPIETAPMDGTHVDLWVGKDRAFDPRVTFAWWDAKEQSWMEYAGYHGIDAHFVSHAPTHWMALPAPPKTE